MGLWDLVSKAISESTSTTKVTKPSKSERLKAEYRNLSTAELAKIYKNNKKSSSHDFSVSSAIIAIFEERGLGFEYAIKLDLEVEKEKEIKATIDYSLLSSDNKSTLDQLLDIYASEFTDYLKDLCRLEKRRGDDNTEYRTMDFFNDYFENSTSYDNYRFNHSEEFSSVASPYSMWTKKSAEGGQSTLKLDNATDYAVWVAGPSFLKKKANTLATFVMARLENEGFSQIEIILEPALHLSDIGKAPKGDTSESGRLYNVVVRVSW